MGDNFQVLEKSMKSFNYGGFTCTFECVPHNGHVHAVAYSPGKPDIRRTFIGYTRKEIREGLKELIKDSATCNVYNAD